MADGSLGGRDVMVMVEMMVLLPQQRKEVR